MASDAGNSTVIPFSSAHRLAKWLIILLLVTFSIDSIAVLGDLLQIDLLNAIMDSNGMAVTDEMIESNDDRQAMIGSFQLIMYPTLALFFIWFYKVYRNLPVLGAEGLEFSPKWAVIYFFVPILSLYKPLYAAEEIWKASYPSTEETDSYSWQNNKTSPIILTWWIFWVISSMVGFYLLRQSFATAATVDELLNLSRVFAFSDLMSAISGGLTVLIVRKIDSWQEKKAALVAARKNSEDYPFVEPQ